MNKFNKYLPSIIFLLLLLILWELYIDISQINQNILPKPTRIISSLFDNWDIISSHALITLQEALAGLFIAILLGLMIAIIVDSHSLLRKILYPLLISSQTIPFVALAPLLLIWFGFGLTPKIIMVVLFCFFPIALSTISGFAHIDDQFIKLFQSMNATRWQILKIVKIPGSIPSFFAGVRIASVYAVTGAIIGEFVGAESGLGIYMRLMANSRATSNLFAAILVTIVLSLILFTLVNILEKLITPWNTPEKNI